MSKLMVVLLALIGKGVFNFLYGQVMIVAIGEAFVPGCIQDFQGFFQLPLYLKGQALENKIS